ncbi:MAG: YbhB/YbcL family Raf kinase inhibitor-like protein [Myxococcota bacterium]
MKFKAMILAVFLSAGLGIGCDKKEDEEATTDDEKVEATKTQQEAEQEVSDDEDQEEGFLVTSSAWEPGGSIPNKYTCDGREMSPPLQWTNVPEGATSFALVVSDPDAPEGTFMHWGMYGIPASETSLNPKVGADEKLESGARQAKNDFEKIGYGAICPPKGEEHTYKFTVLALDTFPSFSETPTVEELQESILTNVIARDTLEGTYKR